MKNDAGFSTFENNSQVNAGYHTFTEDSIVPKNFRNIETSPPEPVTLSADEKYRIQQAIFYRSYDPSVGYNTATVLAGLLIFILMYVFYRTKIRKPLIRFIKRKFKEWTKSDKNTMPSDEETPINVENVQTFNTGKDDVATESKKGDSLKDSSLNFPLGKEKSPLTDNLQCQISIDEHTNLPTLTITDEDNQALPIVFMDIDSVTADWVHKQHQYLSPGGIIVKVKSDNICPQNNELDPSCTNGPITRQNNCTNPHCRLNVKDQVFCGAHSQNALNLCKSIPMFDTHGLTVPQLQNDAITKKQRRKYQRKPTRLHSVTSDCKSPYLRQAFNHKPMLSQMSSLGSEPRPPLIKQSSVPVHLTPVIKIQNIDKSQRNTKTIHRKDSADSISSSSSEDRSFYQVSMDRWRARKHQPPSRSMTEGSPPLSRPPQLCINHSPRVLRTCKQLSLEDACQLGLLIPANNLRQSSLSCQNMSRSEETTL